MPHKPEIRAIHITDTHHGHIDAQTNRSTGSYTTYSISVEYSPDAEGGGGEGARRRYSEFEQLREHLLRHYPHCVVPPIPEKHTLMETVMMYTSIIKREDVRMVEKRKRLLESFLNNILQSDTLSNDTVFRLFLRDTLEWSEESLRLVDLQDKTAVLAVGSVEQAAKKYDGLIDTRLLEHERAFADMKSGIVGLEEAERCRLKKTNQIYESLCDLGCSLNAFSLEYGEQEESVSKQLATTGESLDTDAATLHTALTHLESYCDKLHEQALFCEEAQRLLLFIAASAVRCDGVVKLCFAKRQQLLQDGNAPTKDDPKWQQLEDVEDEKRVVENDYQRVFNWGQEELSKLRRDLQSRLQVIVLSGSVDPLVRYHAHCHKVHDAILQ